MLVIPLTMSNFGFPSTTSLATIFFLFIIPLVKGIKLSSENPQGSYSRRYAGIEHVNINSKIYLFFPFPCFFQHPFYTFLSWHLCIVNPYFVFHEVIFIAKEDRMPISIMFSDPINAAILRITQLF